MMTNKQISKTWEINLLPYVKIQENGVINIQKRKESFKNWIDILVERGNITNKETKRIKYIGSQL